MKKYEYLEIDYTAKGVVFLCTDKHKEVINSYAENGYRYVGFIPTEIDAKGCMRKIDLIFEKKNKKEQRTDIEDDELNFLSKRGSKMLLISAVSTCMESLLGKKILDSWRLVFKDNKNFDKLVEEWKAILDVLMPWHSTLEPAIVSGLKSKEATQNAAKQLRATLTSFSSMYAQQLKPFSDSINTDM